MDYHFLEFNLMVINQELIQLYHHRQGHLSFYQVL